MEFKINIDYFNDRLLYIHNNDEITYMIYLKKNSITKLLKALIEKKMK